MENFDLSDFFKTKSQANDFKTRIATISQMVYETGFTLEKALTEQLGLETKDKLLALVRDSKINTASPSQLKQFFEKIQKIITAIPLLPLTIAFEPKEQTLKALVDWFALNLKKQVIFDISVDHKIIGGATITFNGKFLDMSVKSKFSQIVTTIISRQYAPQPKSTLPVQDSAHMHLGR